MATNDCDGDSGEFLRGRKAEARGWLCKENSIHWGTMWGHRILLDDLSEGTSFSGGRRAHGCFTEMYLSNCGIACQEWLFLYNRMDKWDSQ